MCTSVPSKPPSRASSAERAHQSTTSAMSSGSIAFGVSPYAGDLTADGPQSTRRSSAESLVALRPKWFSCAKITAPCSCTAAVNRRSASSDSGRYCQATRGKPVVEVGCTTRLPVISRPAPPAARAAWYSTLRCESTPASAKSFTCAVCMIRLRTVRLPIWSGLKRFGYAVMCATVRLSGTEFNRLSDFPAMIDEFVLDTPRVREFVAGVRAAIAASGSAEEACEAIRPDFSELLADPSWLPEELASPVPGSGMGGGIGQWLLYRAGDGSLSLFALVVPSC